MFRNSEKHAIPCECIVELYELLWRWGHRNIDRPGFAQNFGFAIPDTIVIVKGRAYAWYFISKKDGALLRKSDQNLSLGLVEKRLCRDRSDGENTQIAATWYPMASQFPEARCHVPNAEFLSVTACRHFLSSMRSSHSGILQAFVEPHGVSNFLVRTVQFREQTSLCVRTNRSLLNQGGKGNPFDRAATFEGWPGLSSTSSRYRSHKHPHMEELIHAAGETLNWRIEQERVRQMLFLGPTQHVALHFKVTKEHLLFFIYASVVSEKEVILQTRPQLLMGDPCMTEALPGAALLPGGTDVKAIPYKGPSPRRREVSGVELKDDDEEGVGSTLTQRLEALQVGSSSVDRSGSLPPLRSARGMSQYSDEERRPPRQRYRSASEKRRAEQQIDISAYIPRMEYARPFVPEAPYLIHGPAGYAGGMAEDPRDFNSLKRPLITQHPSTSASNEPPGSARSLVHTARSEPGPRTAAMDSYRGPPSARPPQAPEPSVLSAAARAQQAGGKPPQPG